MPSQVFIILTDEQRAAAIALNNENGGVDPRAVDNPLAGFGLNLNPDAAVPVGEGVDLAGRFVVPARVLNDPENERFWASLSILPRALLDPEVLFMPILG